jgi:hypothetical protein
MFFFLDVIFDFVLLFVMLYDGFILLVPLSVIGTSRYFLWHI